MTDKPGAPRPAQAAVRYQGTLISTKRRFRAAQGFAILVGWSAG
jgi:hypothetical protein